MLWNSSKVAWSCSTFLKGWSIVQPSVALFFIRHLPLMKYNNAIFNYCLLLFKNVFIVVFVCFCFVLFCFVFYQAHLPRVTFKFTTTVWFICFFLKNQRTIWYFTLANIDIGKLKLCVFHSPLVIEKTVFPVVLFKQTLNQSVSFM